MTISKDSGTTFAVSNSGTDLSFNALSSAVRGAKVLNVNSKINNYVEQNNMQNAGVSLKMQYGFGDENQKNQLDDILALRTRLAIGSGEASAQTKSEGGVRTVYLNNYKSDMSVQEQLMLGIELGHEAYRNGIDDGVDGQRAETLRAVIGHIQMANKVMEDKYYAQSMGNLLKENQNLSNDMLAYSIGGDFFDKYVDGTYDSTADYWKLMNDGRIVWDGSKDLKNERGETIRVAKGEGASSYSKSLLDWFGEENAKAYLEGKNIDTSNMNRTQLAEALLTSNGITWNEEKKAWVNSNMQTDLSNDFSLQLSAEDAFHLGKISQESDSIKVFGKEKNGDNNLKNVMKATGCYYMSTLGCVQTITGSLLSAEQINKITQHALAKGWLAIDEVSIWPTGSKSREEISEYAFEQLGYFGVSLDFTNPVEIRGRINVGETSYGNKHASEWSNSKLLYDPYQGVKYKNPSLVIPNLSYGLKFKYDNLNFWKSYNWRDLR